MEERVIFQIINAMYVIQIMALHYLKMIIIIVIQIAHIIFISIKVKIMNLRVQQVLNVLQIIHYLFLKLNNVFSIVKIQLIINMNININAILNAQKIPKKIKTKNILVF